jgi:hypothetical protein
MSRACAIGALVLAASHADADPIHDFHTLDRHTPSTSVGVSGGFVEWSNTFNGSIRPLAIDVTGQVTGARGAGSYITIPLSYVYREQLGRGHGEWAFANVELGGQYTVPLDMGNELLLRVGAAMPTGARSEQGRLQAWTAFARLPDEVLRWPAVTALRLGASPMGHASRVFWRVDLGVDVGAHEDRYDSRGDYSFWLVHVATGAGVDLGRFEVSAEAASRVAGSRTEAASTVSVGGRWTTRWARLGVAFVLPVSGTDYGDSGDPTWAAAASVIVPLR